MDANERREAIIRILYARGHESLANLAKRFNVSYSTIRRDIDILTFIIPIRVEKGRYSGGVFIDKYCEGESKITSEDELILLCKIHSKVIENKNIVLNDLEINTLNSIISKYMSRKLQKG